MAPYSDAFSSVHFPSPSMQSKKNLLGGALRLDLCATCEELFDVLEAIRRLHNQAFEVFYPSSGNWWLLASSLGTAGECKEIVTGVDREVDEVVHHLGHLVTLLPGTRVPALLPSFPCSRNCDRYTICQSTDEYSH